MRKTRNLVPSGASVRIRPTSKSERNPAVSGLSLSFSFFPAPNVQEASFFLGLSLIIPARIICSDSQTLRDTNHCRRATTALECAGGPPRCGARSPACPLGHARAQLAAGSRFCLDPIRRFQRLVSFLSVGREGPSLPHRTTNRLPSFPRSIPPSRHPSIPRTCRASFLLYFGLPQHPRCV